MGKKKGRRNDSEGLSHNVRGKYQSKRGTASSIALRLLRSEKPTTSSRKNC